MQNREIEELELDLKELKSLLEIAKENKVLIPLIRRRIDHSIKTLESIRDGLAYSEGAETVDTQEKTVLYIQEENLIEEETITIEETIISPEVADPDVKSEESEDPTTEKIPSIVVLGEQLKPAAELSKGLTLNDTFRFSRELFNGDKESMNRVLQDISEMVSLTDAISYLSVRIEWDEENDAVKDFVELLKKYFV